MSATIPSFKLAFLLMLMLSRERSKEMMMAAIHSFEPALLLLLFTAMLDEIHSIVSINTAS
jgi:hypothetical protein